MANLNVLVILEGFPLLNHHLGWVLAEIQPRRTSKRWGLQRCPWSLAEAQRMDLKGNQRSSCASHLFVNIGTTHVEFQSVFQQYVWISKNICCWNYQRHGKQSVVVNHAYFLILFWCENSANQIWYMSQFNHVILTNYNWLGVLSSPCEKCWCVPIRFDGRKKTCEKKHLWWCNPLYP